MDATPTNNCFIASNSDYDGGSLVGYVTCSFAELVQIFGEPNAEGDEYKVSTSWMIEDVVTGEMFEIYDYKVTNLYNRCFDSVETFRAAPSYDWHVGGNKVLNTSTFARFFSEKLGRPVAVRRCTF